MEQFPILAGQKTMPIWISEPRARARALKIPTDRGGGSEDVRIRIRVTRVRGHKITILVAANLVVTISGVPPRDGLIQLIAYRAERIP